MQRIIVYVIFFILAVVLNTAVVSKLFINLGVLSGIETLTIIRIDVLFLFVIHLATTQLLSSSVLVLIFGIIASYFEPVIPTMPLVSAISVYLVARVTNEGFLIRSFYGGGPFVLLFFILERLGTILVFCTILEKPLLIGELLWSALPMGLINALVALPFFSLCEGLDSQFMGVKDDYLRQT